MSRTGTPRITIRAVIVALIGLALAALAVRGAVGEIMVRRGPPTRAVAAAPGDPRAWSDLAALRYAAGDYAAAEQAARRGVEAAPLDARSVRLLVAAMIARGDEDHAMPLLGQAAALGWQDVGLQRMLIDAALKSGAYPVAAERIDAAARRSRRGAEIFDGIDQLLPDAAFRQGIAAQLATRPPWRAAYLRHVRALTPEASVAREKLLLALAGADSPPSRDEMAPYLWQLSDQGRLAEARALWRATNGAAQTEAAAAPAIDDGGFAATDPKRAPLPFEWKLSRLVGASAEIGANPDGDGPGLIARTDGSVSGVIATQSLSLPPGPHRLTLRRFGDARADMVMRWWVRCQPGQRLPVRRSVAPGAASGMLVIMFSVPAECRTQSIELRTETVPIGGQLRAAFDDVAVQ